MKRIIEFFHFQDPGQSMVEFAVAAPLLVLLLYMIMYASDLYVIKSKTLISARYGAWHLARGTSKKADAPAKLGKTFHFNQGVKGKQAGLSAIAGNTGTASLTLTHDSRRFVNPVDANSGNSELGELTGKASSFLGDALAGLLGSKSSSQTTALQVTFEASALPMRLGPKPKGSVPGSFKIIGTHFVDGNSWNGCAVDVHDLWDMVIGKIDAEFMDDLPNKEQDQPKDPRDE